MAIKLFQILECALNDCQFLEVEGFGPDIGNDTRDEDEGTSQHKKPKMGVLHGESRDLQQFTNA
jgi:hypothetical protein